MLDTIVVQGRNVEAKDAPAGATVVSQEDIEKLPVRDLSEVLRYEPGVSLGTGGAGRTGNKRQVDLRGMGPEYTVILVDGVRVSSRDSARFTTAGTRNTLGDTGWVPPGAIERIDIIRGPAAAIYGSGAIGGVINIITKKATDKPTTTINSLVELPQNSKEGWTRQTDFITSGPLSNVLSYRIYGGLSKRDADAPDINGPVNRGAGGTEDVYGLAGRDGLINGNINGLLSWRMTPEQTIDLQGGYSRQNGLFAGELWTSCRFDCDNFVPALMFPNGATWNKLERSTASLTHRGDWSFGQSRITAAFEGTNNQRREETLVGGDGVLSTPSWLRPSRLRNYTLDGDLIMPFQTGQFGHRLTVGFDLRRETLFDEGSTSLAMPDNRPKDPFMAANYSGVFIKDDIKIGDSWIFTPGVRFDNTSYGSHVGPSGYLVWNATNWLSFKGGIANAFKAPNVYQTNPSYVYNSYGYGCFGNGPCYILGNPDLKPETSINKEIGFTVNYEPVLFSLTYFDNDFRNKITTGRNVSGHVGGCSDWTGLPANCNVMQWENAQKARINGLEGRLRWDITDTVALDTNFTTFFESKDTTTGETISFTPKYIVNSTLSWRATNALTLNAIVQTYGKQSSKSIDAMVGGNVLREDSTIDPYTLVGISGIYDINDNLKLRAGISNLFDKKVMRETSNTSGGTNTSYNEPGRTFWAGMSATF